MPRIPIEQKHTYQSNQFTVYGAFFEDGIPTDTIRYQFLNYPTIGTDEENRIGRKIRTDYISYEIYIQLQTIPTLENGIGRIYNSYLDWESTQYNDQPDDEAAEGNVDGDQNSLQSPLNVTVREFLVEFDRNELFTLGDPNLQIFLSNWFQSLNVQTGIFQHASNRNQIKRESTIYTGSYNIIKDKLHHLTLGKQLIHEFGTIKYVRNLNFGTIDEWPTEKALIHFFVGPQNIYIDYGNLGLASYIQSFEEDQISVCNVYSTLKLSYVDV